MVEHERNGLMVSRNDDEGLAHEIARLLDEPGLALRLADAAYAECRHRYTWPTVEREWARTYAELARRSGGN